MESDFGEARVADFDESRDILRSDQMIRSKLRWICILKINLANIFYIFLEESEHSSLIRK